MRYDSDLYKRVLFCRALVIGNFASLALDMVRNQWIDACAAAIWMGTSLALVQGCRLDQEHRDRERWQSTDEAMRLFQKKGPK